MKRSKKSDTRTVLSFHQGGKRKMRKTAWIASGQKGRGRGKRREGGETVGKISDLT